MGHGAWSAGGNAEYFRIHAERDRAVADATGGYYALAGEGKEPPARFIGRALELLGISEIETAERSDDLMTGTWSTLRHPETNEALGTAPRHYADTAENLSKLAVTRGLVLPDHLSPENVRASKMTLSDVAESVGLLVTAEELSEMRTEARANTRHARTILEWTFSADKSASVLHVAAERAGDDVMANACEEALFQAAQAAHDYVANELGASRIGYHGKVVGGQSSGMRVKNSTLAVAAHLQHTSREGDPQDHVHALFLNRGVDETGEWHSLDGQALFFARPSVMARSSRAYELSLANAVGVQWESTGDGLRRIRGMPKEICDLFSKRRAVVEVQLEKWVEKFRDSHGYEPSAKATAVQTQKIARRTRKSKTDDDLGRAESVEAYAEEADQRGTSLIEAYTKVKGAIAMAAVKRLTVRLGRYDADKVIDQAIAQLNKKQPQYNRHHMYAAIDAALPDNWPRGTTPEKVHAITVHLTKRALQREGIACLMPDQPINHHVPAELADEDGFSMFFARGREVYVQAATLEAEAELMIKAREQKAPSVSERKANSMVRIAGLSGDQADAAAGILASGRSLEVLIGPAGAGKSFTLSKLAELWPHATGGDNNVVGLAVSQNAADVLKAEGFPAAVNFARWLMFQRDMADLKAAGRRIWKIHEPFELRPGQLVVIDEASMADTDDLAEAMTLVEAVGGKVLLTGDNRQLDAIGEGGTLAMLATDPQLRADGAIHELSEVRRFKNADGSVRRWEADASLELRVGHLPSLDVYAANGSIIGGTVDEVTDLVVGEAVAAHLSGKTSLIVLEASEAAAAISWRVRQQLVEAGHVSEAKGVASLHDGNSASRGDLIQARKNFREIKDDQGIPISNRDVLVVMSVDVFGGLHCRRRQDNGKLGAKITLPKAYAESKVELAYAATVHAAQGRTVDVSAGLFDPSSEVANLQSLYVSMTRGRFSNRAYVGLGDDDDRTAVEVLADIAERNEVKQTATALKLEQDDAAVSLARLAPAWIETTTRISANAQRRDVERVLEDHGLAESLAADPAAPAFWYAVGFAASKGIDAADALKSTLAGRGVGDAESVAQLLNYRLVHSAHMSWPPKTVSIQRNGDTYLDRSPITVTDPASESLAKYAQHLATVMDARVEQLGHRVASQAPEWATKHLGEVPSPGSVAYQAWVDRAGAIAAYQEQYVDEVVIDLANPIGFQPRKSDFHKHADWQRATTALRFTPTRERSVEDMDDLQLNAAVKQWADAVAEAPEYVMPLLERAHKAYIKQQSYYDRQVAQSTAFSGRRVAKLRDDLTAATSDIEKLTEGHAHRTRWWEDTRAIRELAKDAHKELYRRATEADAAPAGRTKVAPLPLLREDMNDAQAARHDRRLRSDLEADTPYLGRERGI